MSETSPKIDLSIPLDRVINSICGHPLPPTKPQPTKPVIFNPKRRVSNFTGKPSWSGN